MKSFRLLSQVLPGLAIVAIWFVASKYGGLSFFIGHPGVVLRRLAVGIFQDHTLAKDFWVTGRQAVLGLLVGGGLGTLLGVALGLIRWLRDAMTPYVDALGVVPPIAFGPMAVLLLGTGFEMKVGFAALSATLVMLGYAFVGVSALDARILEFVRSAGYRRDRLWSRVVLPASLSWIVGGSRAALAAALVGAFVGELLSSSDGLGHRIQRALGLFDIDGVWVGIVGFAALGMLISAGLTLIFWLLGFRVRHRVSATLMRRLRAARAP